MTQSIAPSADVSTSALTGKLNAMRQYFQSGATRSYGFRRAQLERLRSALLHHEAELYDALHRDLHKNKEEVWITETGFVLAEIKATIKDLKRWMSPERVSTNMLNLPSTSYIYKEPMGVVLIIGPWNYPLQLLFSPLVGAIAAGNVVVLKPSEFAPATAVVMRKIIESTFEPEYISMVEGDGAVVIPAMMNEFSFDHVFFTGSPAIGKIIYEMAAKRMVPVTLELGGKSPCVVESDANLKVAVKRIAVTKFSNAGQMCVAPDYILVHESVKAAFIEEMKHCILKFFSEDAKQSYNYGRIINARQLARLRSYLANGNILHGGSFDEDSLYLEPTLMEPYSLDVPVMQDEIFGPIPPIISFRTAEEARAIIARHPNPLAFYVYTSSSVKEEEWINAVPFGGGCVNNSSWHLTNHNLPFGGRGFSGTGAYHGKFSFDVFSHRKSVMKTPTWFDPAIKYPPFKGKLGLFKKVLG
nr:aldehyde dehydrogenase [Flavihumibacter rivuli]